MIEILVPTPVLEMPQRAQAITIAVFAALTILALAYAIQVSRRAKQGYPLYLFLGAALSVPYECFAAALVHVVYPQQGQWTMIEVLGRPIPVFTWLSYMFYISPLLIFAFEKLDRGELTPKLWWTAYFVSLPLAFIYEVPFLHFGLWQYYGDNQPFMLLGYPVWWAFVSPATFLCMALLNYLIWTRVLRRRHSFVLILLVPLSLFAIHFALSAPLAAAMNTSLNPVLTNLCMLFSIGLALLATWIGARGIELVQPLRIAEEVPGHSPNVAEGVS
jgi:hypothetical protein